MGTAAQAARTDAKRAQRRANTEAWFRRQLTDEHDWQPTDESAYGITLEGHRAWCKAVLAMPSVRDLELAEWNDEWLHTLRGVE